MHPWAETRSKGVSKNPGRTVVRHTPVFSNLRVSICISETKCLSNAAYVALIMFAEKVDWGGRAPPGHRQPRVKDVPAELDENVPIRSPEDEAVDRKLRICRDC